MTLLPYFQITEGESKSPIGAEVKVPYQALLYSLAPDKSSRPNPYRDFRVGGTLIGWRGKNYWISDRRLLGKLIKHFFTRA